MGIESIKKRSGEVVVFDRNKIVQAIYKCLLQIDHKNAMDDAEKVAKKVDKRIDKYIKNHKAFVPSVEDVQDFVEFELMKEGLFEAAKAYILYRDQRNQERKRNIFKPRMALKPYEYPELYSYVDAVRHSYWIHTEFNFTGDIQDFKVSVNDIERNAIQNTMLAIAQIEVSVKTFWGDIYKKMPKPEIGSVGQTFAESEVRHMDAYSHLLEILGLNEDFDKLKDIPVMMQRITYLQNATKNAKSEDNELYAQSIVLFSLFIEHVSLFSQFLIMMAFNKHRNIFKGISNVVEATSKEEQIHGMFGIELVKIIQEENPYWFDDSYKNMLKISTIQAYEAESQVIDWIFEKGELDFLPKKVVNEFIKNRFNKSLESIGMEKIFEIDEKLLAETDWFDDEVMATKHTDFFYKRPINYNKKAQSITGDDLF